MYNKLAKQAYFIMRLRGSGYNVERIFPKLSGEDGTVQLGYSKSDSRMWTIIINPGQASVFCTCYVNNGENDDINPKSKCFFEIYDGGQFIPGRFKIDTASIEVFIERLMKLGIQPVFRPRAPR